VKKEKKDANTYLFKAITNLVLAGIYLAVYFMVKKENKKHAKDRI
jgi:phosphotransferase system  glucose/maltose/N-acetylglucosamine-specific IIC component